MHNEHVVHPGRRLGWRPKDPARKVLRIEDYLTGITVPPHPAVVDHYAKVPGWILGGNDRYGTCGPTSVANHRLMTTTYLASTPFRATDNDVFDLYKRSGNPNFPSQDDGVDMTVMLSALNKAPGLAGTPCVAFASVDASNLDAVRSCIDLFGGVLYGAELDVAQQSQTDQGAWKYVSGSPIWGGHAFLGGTYFSQAQSDVEIITWELIVKMAQNFETHQVQEAYVVLWPETVGSTQFEQAVDRATMAKDYTQLTGRPWPAVVPPPTPVPPVPPAPPGPQPGPPPAPPGTWDWLQELLAWLKAHGWL